MAASPQGRRSAMVHTRGNLEIHRPAREGQGTKIYVRDGREVRHHLAITADAGEAKRVQRYFGVSLVRSRQDQARRYFTRWWPKLAYGTGRWTHFGQGVRPFLSRIRLERRRAFAAVTRHGRDRLRSAKQGCPAQNSRRQFDLPQQRHTDVGAETRRRGRECRSRVKLRSVPRC